MMSWTIGRGQHILSDRREEGGREGGRERERERERQRERGGEEEERGRGERESTKFWSQQLSMYMYYTFQ